jgi:acyl-CoA synthetase (AMP-forming)/AMP-acid ligase II
VTDIVGTRTLPGIVRQLAQDDDQRVFLEHLGSRYTYGEVASIAGGIQALLERSDLQPGDRCAVICEARPASICFTIGAQSAGLVSVPLNPALTTPELIRDLRATRSRALVVPASHFERAAEVAASLQLTLFVVDPDLPSPGPAIDVWLSSLRGTMDPSRITPIDHATLFPTSGSTGQPKWVVYSHGSQVHSAEVGSRHFGVDGSERFLCHFPLFHMNGAVLQIGAAIVTGSTVVLADRFSASNFAGQIREFDITSTHLNATHVRFLLQQPVSPVESDNRLRGVRSGLSLSAAEVAEFEQRYKTRLVQHYGLSESTGIVTCDSLGGPRRIGSLGRPCLDYTIRLVADDGELAATGQPGEIQIASSSQYGLMVGYFDDPVLTAATLRDGWLSTGDVGRFDEDGNLWFVGRIKDVIKRGGETVAPNEIELVISGIHGVTECAVVGIPDPIYGEAVKAYVVLDPGVDVGLEALVEVCGRNLASYKVPTSFEFVAELPHNAVGKIDKRRLRDWLRSNQPDSLVDNGGLPSRRS